MTPEQIRNQCEDDADRAPSDLTVWRDRGAIIAQQQARIAELESQFARVVAFLDDRSCRNPWMDGDDRVCGHPDHGGFWWPDGQPDCNGAQVRLAELRGALS